MEHLETTSVSDGATEKYHLIEIFLPGEADRERWLEAIEALCACEGKEDGACDWLTITAHTGTYEELFPDEEWEEVTPNE